MSTAPASRPVHPCVVSLTNSTRGAEFCTWANLVGGKERCLVTASASTILVYTVVAGDKDKPQLKLKHVCGNMAGTVVSLHTISGGRARSEGDALLCGFAGHSQLSVLQLMEDGTLQAVALLDLTAAVQTANFGALTTTDMIVAATGSTAAFVLGGGVAVAVSTLSNKNTSRGGRQRAGRWTASEPYILPLQSLSTEIYPKTKSGATLAMSLSTGFGDIIDAIFLQGYLEPVLVLLHTDCTGRITSGRLANSGVTYRCTAISVSTSHSRTAVLWSVAVSCDSLYMSCGRSSLLVVVGANGLTFLGAGGRMLQCLAVNGWAGTTAPPGTNVAPNFPIKLSIQLDGSRMCWLSDTTALLSLRRGQLYVLQQTTSRADSHQWTLLPKGQTLGSIGSIASLTATTSGIGSRSSQTSTEEASGFVFAGSRLGDSMLLRFVLDVAELNSNIFADSKYKEETMQPASNDFGEKDSYGMLVSSTSDGEQFLFEDEALYADPDMLTDSTQPTIVPTSDDEGEKSRLVPVDKGSLQKRSKTTSKSAFIKSLDAVDTIVNLGPLGPSCEGPLACAPSFKKEIDPESACASKAVCGSSAHVFPAGYGSSGGIALVTVAGRDDRMILAEEDCLSAESIFGLESSGVVCLGMSDKVGGGFRILRINKDGAGFAELNEISKEDWCIDSILDEMTNFGFSRLADIFESTILMACEFRNTRIAMVVQPKGTKETILILASSPNNATDKIEILKFHKIALGSEADEIESSAAYRITPLTEDASGAVAFGCLFSCGKASVVNIFVDNSIGLSHLDDTAYSTLKDDAMDTDDIPCDGQDSEAKELLSFYSDERVVAIDLFCAPPSTFNEPTEDTKLQETRPFKSMKRKHESDQQKPMNLGCTEEPDTIEKFKKMTVAKLKEELKRRGLPVSGRKADLIDTLMKPPSPPTPPSQPQQSNEGDPAFEEKKPEKGKFPTRDRFNFDEDDDELYGLSEQKAADGTENLNTILESFESQKDTIFVAICKQSGTLEIYKAGSLAMNIPPCWTSKKASFGASRLKNELGTTKSNEKSFPKSHRVFVREFRFFSCCASASIRTARAKMENLCLAIETSLGDLLLYAINFDDPATSPELRRIELKSLARPSQEQLKHHSKLKRKGILGEEKVDTKGIGKLSFAHNTLHRFTKVSGQDGMFAAGPRPQWFVSERGRPSVLAHRTRYAAPAGGSPRPVRGFSSSINIQDGFITLHERVGRVGSQRLTVYKGLSTLFDSHGLLPGSGYCVEKISLGVTVRRVLFLNDDDGSPSRQPLFALLVSREVEVDQSDLNSDGLSHEERKRIESKKEAVKIQKQVEADLGGFDMDSEWVEAIERENVFHVDTDLGGSPPIQQSIYSLWIVDAANQWIVVDSHEFSDLEHAIELQMMSLTEFKEDPGNSANSIADADSPKRRFLTVGTGIVTNDGEDVATKGRVLLFELKRPSAETPSSSVDLSLVYEKNIFHGPVTTLSCLSSEGKSRLVVGAGSDINIEQWGNSKLTQVGFFRATMHIIHILHFKSFLILSDAYDSMYFLVWRESDKSLTLLAKDYDPIPVYASGIIARGAGLTFICHDDRQNLQFFQYTPGEAAARGGNKLVCRADFHLGSQTSSFTSYFCRPSLVVHSATPLSTVSALKQQDALFGRQDDDQRLGVHFGTSDGGLASIVPLSEPVYWRLKALQSVLSNALDAHCGLSQIAWRLYRRSPRRCGCRNNERKKNVIDGDLVLQYSDLSLQDQEDIASAIGSTVELIIDNLLEVQCASMVI